MPESVLDRIVDAVRRRLEECPAPPDLGQRAREAAQRRARQGLRSLRQALVGRRPAVIAECKRASPSAGLLRADFDPVALASAYAAAGAAAVSVVTEPDFFAGDPTWIAHVRERSSCRCCARTSSSAAGSWRRPPARRRRGAAHPAPARPADAARAAARGPGAPPRGAARGLRRRRPGAGSRVRGEAGGGQRADLATFEVRLDRLAAMAAAIPADRVRVAESGIHGRADLERLAGAGYQAFLVGEHLVRAADPGAALRALIAAG